MIKSFKSKMQLFDYIKRKFSKHEVILIQGSTAHGKVKNFSEIKKK